MEGPTFADFQGGDESVRCWASRGVSPESTFSHGKRSVTSLSGTRTHLQQLGVPRDLGTNLGALRKSGLAGEITSRLHYCPPTVSWVSV